MKFLEQRSQKLRKRNKGIDVSYRFHKQSDLALVDVILSRPFIMPLHAAWPSRRRKSESYIGSGLFNFATESFKDYNDYLVEWIDRPSNDDSTFQEIATAKALCTNDVTNFWSLV